MATFTHPGTPAGRSHPPASWLGWQTWFLLIVAASTTIVASAIRPLPFALTDDNWMYFLPLLKSHWDAALTGNWLSVNWALGPGWSPWDSGQIGGLYLPYMLSNLIARAIGEPLAMLDVSAAIHLGAAGIIAYRLLPNSIADPNRLLFALLLQLPTGPLLLGLNWHNYLAPLPWFLAVGLLMIKHADGAPWNRADRVLLWMASALFFISSHVQIYVFGMALLLLWTFVISDSVARNQTMKWLIVAQLPAAFPLIYLKWVTLGANPDWFANRDSPQFVLNHAQYLSAVMQGTLWGNLLFTNDFRLWAGIDWRGIGIFFSPGLILGAPMWVRRNRYRPILFFSFGLLLMGIASAPFLQHLFVGPFAGFRWTWKLSALFGPLAMLTFIRYWQVEEVASVTGERIAVTLLVLASLFIFMRGLQFEILPSLRDAHRIGPRGLVEETRAMASASGLKEGTRIALIGRTNMSQPLPIPFLGLLGNSPLLSGLETAHVYEPMEPAALLRDHLGLTLPWRGAIAEEEFFADPETALSALREVGVQAVISINPSSLAVPGTAEYRDSLGRITYVMRVENAMPGPFPDGGSGLLQRMADGRLRTDSAENPPQLVSSRTIRWVRQADGHWIGTPQVLGLHWALGTIVFAALGLWLVIRSPRPT